MNEKQKQRKQFLNKRNSLSKDQVSVKSGAVFERLSSMNEYKKADVILAYMSFGNEVMTQAFISKCMSDGKMVALPRVETTDGEIRMLKLYEVRDLKDDLEEGFKRILEPVPSRSALLEPGKIDLAVIPGIAFDILLNRMGYGAGYYDRLLPLLRADCPKVGVAFEIQMADIIPVDKHDFSLDMVITEKRCIIKKDGKDHIDE